MRRTIGSCYAYQDLIQREKWSFFSLKVKMISFSIFRKKSCG